MAAKHDCRASIASILFLLPGCLGLFLAGAAISAKHPTLALQGDFAVRVYNRSSPPPSLRKALFVHKLDVVRTCRVRRKITHPLDRFSELGCSAPEYDSNTKRNVFGEVSTRYFQRLLYETNALVMCSHLCAQK